MAKKRKTKRPKKDSADDKEVVHCVIYGRCSTDEQASGEYSTIETQISRSTAAIEARTTASKEFVLVDVYKDEGASGKDIKGRPEFQRLLADAEEGRISVVYATRLDRLSRSTRDFLDTIERFNELGVGVTLLDEELDTSTPTGRFAMTMMVALAQLERENVAVRTIKKMVWRAQQGLWNGSRVIGYTTTEDNPGILQPIKDEVEVVNLIFSKYIELGSATQVVKYLNENGYRTPWVKRKGGKGEGKHFQTTGVLNILRNETYLGKIIYRDEIYEGKHKGIIDKALFKEVQETLGRHAPKRTNRKRACGQYIFLFQGLLRCGYCLSAMTPTYSGNKNTGRGYHVYYECTGRAKKGKSFCEARRLPAKAIDEALIGILRKVILDEDEMDRVLAENAGVSTQLIQDLTQRKDVLTRELAADKIRMDKLLDMAEAGKFDDRNVFWKRYDKLDLAMKEQEHDLSQADAQIKQAKKGVADRTVVVETMGYLSDIIDKAPPVTIKSLLPRFVEVIEISEEEARVGIFERPTRASYSITQILGNAAIPDIEGVNPDVANGSESIDWLPRLDSNQRPID